MHSTKIDVIILAGGKGSRLMSVLPDIPKPMAPIHGKPFLDILLYKINRSSNIKRVILAVGYKSETIITNYKNVTDYNFNIQFSVEKTLLGTGGAIKKALSFADTVDVLVLNGDSYIEVDFDSLMKFHKTNYASITIVLKKIINANRYGNVKVDNQHRILSFEEKESSKHAALINTGVYLMNKSLFDNIDKDREISFEREILPDVIQGGAYGYVTEGNFIDIGIPDDYKRAQTELAQLVRNII